MRGGRKRGQAPVTPEATLTPSLMTLILSGLEKGSRAVHVLLLGKEEGDMTE